MGVISHCPEKHTTFIHPLSTSFLVSLVQLTDVFYQYRVWIIMVLCCASLHQMPLYAADDNSLIYEILTKQIWRSWSFFTKFPQFFLFTSLLNAVTSFCWIQCTNKMTHTDIQWNTRELPGRYKPAYEYTNMVNYLIQKWSDYIEAPQAPHKLQTGETSWHHWWHHFQFSIKDSLENSNLSDTPSCSVYCSLTIMREIVHLQIGQCGNQIGSKVIK